jgi:hypothetical protein
MKSITMLGILLAVLGILALVYQGFNYTHEQKVLDVGPIHATRDDTQHISVPPIVGGLAYSVGLHCSSSVRSKKRDTADRRRLTACFPVESLTNNAQEKDRTNRSSSTRKMIVEVCDVS